MCCNGGALPRHNTVLLTQAWTHLRAGQAATPEEPSPAPPSSPPGLPTSFLHALQSSAWLPSSLGGVQPPSALFYPSPQALSLLGDHVPYLAYPFKEPSLLTALGVITDITWHHLLRTLSSWSTLASFESSVQQMSGVYTFLNQAMEREPGAAQAICAAFARLPLIWLPAKHALGDITTAAAQGTPFQHDPSLPLGDFTPRSTRTHRKSRKKVNFMTPATQVREGPHGGTPAAPAYTPYTVTPGWKAPVPSQGQSQGQFYAATGDSLRLWDPTGVIEGLPATKLGLRILSQLYTGEAVMTFFAEGLVHEPAPQPSPKRQVGGLEVHFNNSEPTPHNTPSPGKGPLAQQLLQQQPQQPQQQPQQQLQQQPQQQQPQPSLDGTATASTVQAAPARAAPSFGQADYIDLISSDEDLPDAAPSQEPNRPPPTQPAAAPAAAPNYISMDQPDPAEHLPEHKPQQARPASGATPADQHQPRVPADSPAPVVHGPDPARLPAAVADHEATNGLDPAQAALASESPIEAADPGSPPPPPHSPPPPQSMILGEPTCRDYCRALAAVTEPVPAALHATQLRQALAILRMWSGRIAAGAMTDQDISELRSLLGAVTAFPLAGQRWAPLSEGLILNDDPALAALFEGAKGVALLHLPDK